MLAYADGVIRFMVKQNDGNYFLRVSDESQRTSFPFYCPSDLVYFFDLKRGVHFSFHFKLSYRSVPYILFIDDVGNAD